MGELINTSHLINGNNLIGRTTRLIIRVTCILKKLNMCLVNLYYLQEIIY